MSNVIAFPNPAERSASKPDPVSRFVTSYSAVSANLLRGAIDTLEQTLVHTQTLIDAMPQGQAREEAQAEMAALRRELERARVLNEDITGSGAGPSDRS
jgi:hypothetical protein